MSNHDMARMYINKHRLLGVKCNFVLRLEDNDEVVLVDVKDKNNTGRLVIPSFITKIDGVKCDRIPLMFCNYSEIYVDNQKDRLISAKYLCAGMRSNELKVVFKYPENVVSTYGMFENDVLLEKVDISGISLQNVVNMRGMFKGCNRLSSIYLGNQNKYSIKKSKVKVMTDMFKDCCRLRGIDLSGLDLTYVERMDGLFYNCRNLIDVKLDGIKTKELNDISSMFKGCMNLERVDLGSLNINNVKKMNDIFNGCEMLSEVYISSCRNVIDLSNMFKECSNLEYIDISKIDLSKVSSTREMFKGCTRLKDIGIKEIDLRGGDNRLYRYV